MIDPSVFKAYGVGEKEAVVTVIGNGLIHQTWKVSVKGKDFVLQKLNTKVFHQPENIAANIKTITDHLRSKYPDYIFPGPVETLDGKQMAQVNGNYYRLFHFIPSVTYDTVLSADIAYEAATQFGRFARMVSGLEPKRLQITIPRFHDLAYKFDQFTNAVNVGNPDRITQSDHLVKKGKDYSYIVRDFQSLIGKSGCRLRISHHDTKISNVLFTMSGKGICVVDPDTIMPGFFFSDLGDMMRTYLSPANEEEADTSKIGIVDEHYKAIIEGYGNEMRPELNAAERRAFFQAGMIMIYMQALRFLTDHLLDDIYYGARYPDHNLVRAMNQFTLLDRFVEKKKNLSWITG